MRLTCDPVTKTTQLRSGGKYLLPVLLIVLVFVAVGGWLSFSYFYTPGWQGTLRGHQGWVTCLAFTPDAQTLATGGQDRTVRLWDLAIGKEREILMGHRENVVAVAFSPDGRLLASASEDGSVRVWEVGSGQQRAVLLGHARPDQDGTPLAVHAVSFSPDGRLLASGGADETVRLWDVATGKELGVLKHTMEVRSLAITADGKLLASRTEDGVITVWDLAGRRELRRFDETHMRDRRCCLILGPDGKVLASNGTNEEKVKLWDVTTGELQATLKAKRSWQDWPINSMAFTPDGKVLAGTTMFGARMVFWDTSSGQLLGSIHFPPQAFSIAFSPNGKTCASAHEDGTVKLWESTELIPRK